MPEERMLVDPAYNDLGLAFATPIGTAIDPSKLPAYLDERKEGGRPRVRSILEVAWQHVLWGSPAALSIRAARLLYEP